MNLTDVPLGGKGINAARALAIGGRPVGLVAHYDATSSTGTFTATRACIVLIRAGGAGASGSFRSGHTAAGGGGGAMGYKVVRLAAGQSVSWSIGAGGASQAVDGAAPSGANDGGDTTVTIPGGYVLTAGGGKAGALGVGGLGGVATGFDINRRGGAGGSASTDGESPTGGGTGGATSSTDGGGGGAAGFSDLFPGINSGAGGVGNTSAAGGSPGAGSAGAGAASGAGGAGRLILTAIEV